MTSKPISSTGNITKETANVSQQIKQRAAIWPGMATALIVTSSAFAIARLPVLNLFSPMILAIVVGIILSSATGPLAQLDAGISFCKCVILRTAIVLLGFQINIQQIASIGFAGLGIVTIGIIATFSFTLFLGRALKVDKKLTILIASGTSICGASAIAAVNSVIKGREEDVASSVASITLFGTVCMLGFPFLAAIFLDMSAYQFGLWSGAAIHEVAQVVGAGFQHSQRAGEVSVISKLARITLLIPLILAIALLTRNGQENARSKAPLPWFCFAFLAASGLNSFTPIPEAMRQALNFIVVFFLTVGLGALGLQTNLGKLSRQGWRPFTLAFAASLFIAGLSLALVLCLT